MFDAITEKPRPRRWQTAVIIGSALAHAAVITGVVVGAMWQVEKLDLASGIDITFRVPPPPGESAPPPAAKKLAVQTEQVKPVKVTPQVPVQPTIVKDPEPDTSGGGGDTKGTGTDGNGTDPTATGTCVGAECVPGGLDTGTGKPECSDGVDNDGDGKTDRDDPACKAGEDVESKDPKQTPVLPPNVAKGLRLSGNEQIYPPEMTRVEMLHQGKDVVQATVQVCVGARGSVDSVRLLKATGFRDYDAVLTREIREWKYRPYFVDGKASPMCTVAVIIYRMKK
jgi:outer membrane biosynthesis protein TonB